MEFFYFFEEQQICIFFWVGRGRRFLLGNENIILVEWGISKTNICPRVSAFIFAAPTTFPLQHIIIKIIEVFKMWREKLEQNILSAAWHKTLEQANFCLGTVEKLSKFASNFLLVVREEIAFFVKNWEKQFSPVNLIVFCLFVAWILVHFWDHLFGC